MTKREKLDPSWHKSRIAARIWMKAQQGRPLSSREKRLAGIFANDRGVEKIQIGIKEFQCMGASPPYDHPHVFLDMGGDRQVICPYCSTLFVLDDRLHGDETEPAGCAHHG